MVLAMFWSSLPTMLKLSRHLMATDVLVVMDGQWSLHVLSESLCKSPARLPYVFFCPATLEPIDHSTLLQDGVPVFGVYQEILDGITSLKVHVNPMFSANVLAALPHALNVWDNYVWPVVATSLAGSVVCPLISVVVLPLMGVYSR